MQPQAALEFTAQVRSQLLAELASVSDADFTRPVSPGTWSIAEVLEHIRQVDQELTRRFAKVAAGERPSEKRLLQRIKGTFSMAIGPWVIAKPLFRVKAPAFVQPLEVPPRQELLAALHQLREQTLGYVQTCSQEQLQQWCVKHPVFGALTFYEMLLSLAYHEQRHIVQIQHIKHQLLTR